MAGIKQTVPNYIFGASNQPDQLKIPGFVSEAINIYPDVTEGCEKRPGTRHINTLSLQRLDDSPGVNWITHYQGKWFALDYGANESFIGNVSKTGHVRVFECATGVEWPVHHESNDYCRHSGDDDIQVVSINDRTIMLNRSVATRMDTSGATTAPAQGNKAFIDLSAISYGKQYTLDITAGDAHRTTNPRIITRATKLSIRWHPGGDRRGDSDNDSGHNVDSEESCRHNTREVRTINAAGLIRAASNPTEYAAGDITNLPGRNLRFEVSMIGTPYIAGYHGSRDGEPYYWALYEINIDLLHGGEGWRPGDEFYIHIGSDNSNGPTTHLVKIEEVETIEVYADHAVRPEPTTHDGSQVLTADKILDNLKDEIERTGPDSITSITKIGSGLLLEGSQPLTVTTTEGNLMSIIGSEASSAADLPSQCEEGYVVKIRNSSLDEDDYYLKFTGKNTWIETVAPGSFNHINARSMPQQLRYVPSPAEPGTEPYFELIEMEWADRLAGDNKTNPKPTFLKFGNPYDWSGVDSGSPISNVLFWRNRLVLLSKNNICLTQPLKTGEVSLYGNQVYDVWGKSAIALSPGDAIDIIATSNQVCDLKHGIEVNAGLMLFSEYEQFLLTTDSDVVTPETVKVKRVSSWSYNQACPPISLGNSIAFCDNAGMHSRLFEMSNITRETEPIVTELSKPITESIPTGVKSIAESRENGLVVLAHNSPYIAGTPDPWVRLNTLDYPDSSVLQGGCQSPYNFVYCYKYFNSGNKRIQSAWFKWKFSGRVIWHTIIRDTYYFILDNDQDDVRLEAMDLVRKDNSFLNPNRLTEKCGPQRTHLDGMVDVTETAILSATGTHTLYPIPASLTEWGKHADPFIGGRWGHWGLIVYSDNGFRITALPYLNVFETQFIVEGDTTGNQAIMGFAYDMILKFPEIYPTKKAGDSYIADTTSALTVHRCKFSMGLSGPFEIDVTSKDRRTHSMMHSCASQHTHAADNALNVLSSQTVDVPIYQPNTDFKLEFISGQPTPCTLNSMTWEGDYNTLYRSA